MCRACRRSSVFSSSSRFTTAFTSSSSSTATLACSSACRLLPGQVAFQHSQDADPEPVPGSPSGAPPQLCLELGDLLGQVGVELLGQLSIPLQFGVLGRQLPGTAPQPRGLGAAGESRVSQGARPGMAGCPCSGHLRAGDVCVVTLELGSHWGCTSVVLCRTGHSGLFVSPIEATPSHFCVPTPTRWHWSSVTSRHVLLLGPAGTEPWVSGTDRASPILTRGFSTCQSLGADPSCRHAAIQAPMAVRKRLQSSAVPAAAGSSALCRARSRPSCPLCPVIAATYSTTRCGCTSPAAERGPRHAGDRPGGLWLRPPRPQGLWLPVRSGSQAAKVQSRANSSEQPLSAGAEGGTWVMEGPDTSLPTPLPHGPSTWQGDDGARGAGTLCSHRVRGCSGVAAAPGHSRGRGFLGGPGSVAGLRGSRWGGAGIASRRRKGRGLARAFPAHRTGAWPQGRGRGHRGGGVARAAPPVPSQLHSEPSRFR